MNEFTTWSVGHVEASWSDPKVGQLHRVPIHVGEQNNKGNVIAVAHMGGNAATKFDSDSVLATAKLIAAAPTMLDALERAEHSLEHALVWMPLECDRTMIESDLTAVKLAIRQARGKN
jgi:hypothetical protein